MQRNVMQHYIVLTHHNISHTVSTFIVLHVIPWFGVSCHNRLYWNWIVSFCIITLSCSAMYPTLLYHIVSFLSYCDMFCHIQLFHFVLYCNIISCYIIRFNIISYPVMLFCFVSHCVKSGHIISCYKIWDAVTVMSNVVWDGLIAFHIIKHLIKLHWIWSFFGITPSGHITFKIKLGLAYQTHCIWECLEM